MYKLGITGGIGSGKSTASNFFKKNGAIVFNADKEAKKHLKNTKVLQKRIIDAFGQKIVESNNLSIKKLAEVAFSSKVDQSILNGLMWPEVFILVEEAMEEARKKGVELYVVDAAMIFEANFEYLFDTTLLISTRKNLRINRALKRKNLHLEQIQNRMSLQMPEIEKKRKADHVISNDSTEDKFLKKLNDFLKKLNI